MDLARLAVRLPRSNGQMIASTALFRIFQETLRERAAILGGQVNISSAPGKGTTVTAWIPLPSPETSGTMLAAIP